MQSDDRFYTSTEVAEILGVSLRSVYRYLEEGKLLAEIKTATGRHRFSKQNILDFLYPDGKRSLLFDEQQNKEEKEQQVIKKHIEPVRPDRREEIRPTRARTVEVEEEEPVDWLSKFREAASKYKQDQKPYPQQTYSQQPEPLPEIRQEPPAPYYEPEYQQPIRQEPPQYTRPEPQYVPQRVEEQEPLLMFYRSMLGGLKDIAQNLDKSARNSNLSYAFTLNAGASLYKPIKPFAVLHAYIKSSDRDFFEKILRLTPANKNTAQLCLVISDDSAIYGTRDEIHGLYVVSKNQLKKDIAVFGDPGLASEIADVIS